MSANHATPRALVKAFNDHDLDRIITFFTDDAVLKMQRAADALGSRFAGAATVRGALRGRLAGLPDVHYGDDSHCTGGDMGISQWTLTGTPASGQPIKVRGCDFYTFRGGKVIKKDSFWKIVEK